MAAVELFSGLASAGGHWYTKDGTPAYEIIGKNGKQRAVTLRDARQLGLVPGFSSIAQQEYKPALEQWKINQAYLACLTLPPIPGESLQDFRKRAETDAGAQAEKARNRGVDLHAALEAWYQTGAVSEANEPYVMPVVAWLYDNCHGVVWQPERSFACAEGYGGKIDLYAPGVVVDFKFKDFDDPAKIRGYDEHEMQLAAYAHGLGDPAARLINLFISSTVPGLIVPVEWEPNTDAYEAFRCLLRLWQIRKGYVP